MEPIETQRFHLVLATDGDVTATEIRDILQILGYHGVTVTETPAPSQEAARTGPASTQVD